MKRIFNHSLVSTTAAVVGGFFALIAFCWLSYIVLGLFVQINSHPELAELSEAFAILGAVFTGSSFAGLYITFQQQRQQIKASRRVAFDTSFFELLVKFRESRTRLECMYDGKTYKGDDVLDLLATFNKQPEKDDKEFYELAQQANVPATAIYLYAISQVIKVSTLSKNEVKEYMDMIKRDLRPQDKFVYGKLRFIQYSLWTRDELPHNIMDEIVEYLPYGYSKCMCSKCATCSKNGK